ncbi:FadR family transcriptional regulator [Sphingomonas daechungensis]|uniref:FadR family transcriptional regulator n=1 Tax=Sphingomonas daechungensis TaxID=1176646 RepID=A0ABX6T5L9_9SPHN|nr:FadR family transcriptional regulator [Sphingomonas daechungensis]
MGPGVEVARPASSSSECLRIHGKLARDLGVQIVSGVIRPGELLETELAASERHQVSRAAYREAVRILAAKGLVVSRPKVGTRVTPREQWHLLDPDVLAWIFQSDPEDQVLEALFELRMVVEPEAAALAAERRTSDQVAIMREALRDMTEHTLGTAEGRAADQRFHTTLLLASANPFLRTLTSSISTAVSWTTALKQRVRPLVRDPVPDHAEVLEAIASRDPDAARRAMRKLVELALFDTRTAPQAPSGRRSKRSKAA